MVNRVALHKCKQLLLKIKEQKWRICESIYCRFHFGEQDQISKKMSGKRDAPL